MTELREQLLSARNEHRSARYPGNLAGELLPPVSTGRSAPPWGVGTFAVRLVGVAFAAAAAVALVVVRPPDRMTDPRPDGNQHHFAPGPSANAARPGNPQGWWFAPDMTFASAAAERVKTVASRVQMRVTSPYRDLLMPHMPELPALAWPDWVRDRDRDADAESPDGDASPQAGPSTQQSA